jgi:hypothetical protein
MLLKVKYGILPVLMVMLIGCSGSRLQGRPASSSQPSETRRSEEAYRQRIGLLQNDLAALNQQADLHEARQVAETAIFYSRHLADEYRLVQPAVLHNVLIRVGLKERGLCYHWTEDLLEQLQTLDLSTYQLHWGVAYRGSQLREHNSVVITARGKMFETGMVLDPWRNSGDLYWSLIKTDRYPWKELPPSQW